MLRACLTIQEDCIQSLLKSAHLVLDPIDLHPYARSVGLWPDLSHDGLHDEFHHCKEAPKYGHDPQDYRYPYLRLHLCPEPCDWIFRVQVTHDHWHESGNTAGNHSLEIEALD